MGSGAFSAMLPDRVRLPALASWVKNPMIRLLVPPVAGFLFYGLWAFFANMDHGCGPAAKAFLTQGSYSFVITLSLALLIEWLYRLLQRLPYRAWWVGVIACLLLYSTSWGINFLAGTPNILLTILPGAAFSTVYAVIYVMALVNINTVNISPQLFCVRSTDDSTGYEFAGQDESQAHLCRVKAMIFCQLDILFCHHQTIFI